MANLRRDLAKERWWRDTLKRLLVGDAFSDGGNAILVANSSRLWSREKCGFCVSKTGLDLRHFRRRIKRKSTANATRFAADWPCR
jgi:hypothetical protein